MHSLVETIGGKQLFTWLSTIYAHSKAYLTGVTKKKQELHKTCGKLKHSTINRWKSLLKLLWKKKVIKSMNILSTIEIAKNVLEKTCINRKLGV